MTLEGQVDCRTPRTLQAGSGAPYLPFASQGQPGVRVLLPRTVGKTTPAPRPCTAPAWGNGGPVGPLAAPLLSPTWAESHRTSQGPGRDASRAAMTPWAEHEKSALCFWSLLPRPCKPSVLGLWDTPQGACGFGPHPHLAEPSEAQGRSAGGVPHSSDGAALGE